MKPSQEIKSLLSRAIGCVQREEAARKADPPYFLRGLTQEQALRILRGR